MIRISHPDWVKLCVDPNGRIKLRAKQKYEILSVTFVLGSNASNYLTERKYNYYITHSHLLKGEDAPVCPTCKVQLTTKHILLNCKHICTKYYQARNLRDIFKNTNPENIFNFLKKKQLFQQDITKHLYRTTTLMTKIQNNLFDIKWPTGVDMLLDKTQTQTKTITVRYQCLKSLNTVYTQKK